jgi:hypothetical protein
MKNIILLVAVYLMLPQIIFSCSNTEEDSVLLPELVRAEAIMFQHPDSALYILERMLVPPTSKRLQHATWCLLMTQAKYKNYIKQSSDSLIDIGYDYFMQKDDLQRKAMALYYKGALCIERSDPEAALQYYLKAVKYLDNTTNYRQGYLIHIAIAEIYLYRKLDDYAMKSCKEAYQYAKLLDDKSYITTSLVFLARVYGLKKDWEMSVKHYREALELTKLINNLSLYSGTLSELATVYCETKNYSLALDCARKSLEIREKECLEIEQSCHTLGQIYQLTGQVDSAYYCFQKAILSDNIYTKRGGYYALFSLSKAQQDYAKAVEYSDQLWFYEDSIRKIDRGKELIEIQEKYNQEKLLNEKNQLKIEKAQSERKSFWMGIFLLATLIIVVYFYQRRLIQRERTIQKNQEMIRMYSYTLLENESLIGRNENRIKELLREIEQNQEMQELIEEQRISIEEMERRNMNLREENKNLRKNIHHYSISKHEESSQSASLRILSEENMRLRAREKFLCGQLIEKIEFLNKLKKFPQYLDVIQWDTIYHIVNELFEDYTKRLSKQFPSLTKNDLQLCCLIKLHFSVANMAIFFAISPTAVTKRKQRLKEQIVKALGKPLEENQTLDLWLWEY